MDDQDLNLQLQQVALAVKNNECVVFLGPRLVRLENEDKEISLIELLAFNIAQKVLDLGIIKSPLIDPYNLSYVAQRLEDSLEILKREGNTSYLFKHSRDFLGNIFSNFFKSYETPENIPEEYILLAKMPFNFIINTSPDIILVKAYENDNKFLASENAKFFHYKDPSHNNDENNWPGQITKDTPLIYNLFGSIEKAHSLVITEKDQLHFIDTILQKESRASIPASIAIHFVSNPQIMRKKTFLFLGFDFGDWRIKLIMHLIHRYQNEWSTFTSLYDAVTLSEIEKFFYQKNFNVHFNELSLTQFLNEFKKVYDNLNKTVPITSKLKVFIMYDEADKNHFEILMKKLAPIKRAEAIESWHFDKIQPGSLIKESVSKNLVESDIIIQLISSDFLASETIYNNQIEVAMARHIKKEATIVPIIVRSCDWRLDSKLSSLQTILPAPRGYKSIAEMGTPEIEWQRIIEQLQKIIEITIKRKN